MNRTQPRREQIVGKYHRNMLIFSLGASMAAAIGLIIALAMAPQIDDIGNELAYWLLGLPPAMAASVLIFYFAFVIAFTCWVQYKRHEH